MSLFPLVEKSRAAATLHASTYWIYVDKANLHTCANYLSSHQSVFEKHLSSRLPCLPIETLRLLFTMQFFVFNAHLGTSGSMSNTDGYSFSAWGENGPVFQDRISEYVEFIYDKENTHVGWRFCFVICCPEYSLEFAMDSYWKIIKKKTDKEFRKPEKFDNLNQLRPSQNFNEWISMALGPYLNERIGDESTLASIYSLGILDDTNPCNAASCLTLEHTNFLIMMAHGEENIPPEFLDEFSYLNEGVATNTAEEEESKDSEDSDEELFHDTAAAVAIVRNSASHRPSVCVKFPRGAYPLEHKLRTPDALFKMDLATTPTPPANALTNPNFARYNREFALYKKINDVEPVLMRSKKWCSHSFVGRTPKERNTIRASKTAMDMFMSVRYTDMNNPAGIIATAFLAKKANEVEGWSTIPDSPTAHDPSMTEFGNYTKEKLLCMDLLFGVTVMHSLASLMYTGSMLAWDSATPGMSLNFLLTGPAMGGKSFIQSLVNSFLVPETWEKVSHISKKGFTASTNKNGIAFIMDELAAMLAGKENPEGDELFKELLTSGWLKNLVLHIDKESNDRVTPLSMSCWKANFRLCTNMSKCLIPEPIVSRFHCVAVPFEIRLESDPRSEHARLSRDPAIVERVDKFRDRLQIKHAQSFDLGRMINMGLIDNVYMELANVLITITKSYLTRVWGIIMCPRTTERLEMTCAALAIEYAVHTVFHTDTVFPPGTPFEISQYLECTPYMFCTPEMFYCAFGMLEDAISNPVLIIVLRAIRRLAEAEADDSKRYALNEGGTIDYNYFSIRASSELTSVADVEHTVCRKIRNAIVVEGTHDVSENGVMDVIRSLIARTKMVLRCDDSGTTYGEVPENMSIAKKQTCGNSYGVNFLRLYVLSTVEDNKCIVTDCIKHTCGVIDGMPERVVTGLTYRFKPAPTFRGEDTRSRNLVSTPFLLQVIDTKGACSEQNLQEIPPPLQVKEGMPVHVRQQGEARTFNGSDSSANTGVQGAMDRNKKVKTRVRSSFLCEQSAFTAFGFASLDNQSENYEDYMKLDTSVRFLSEGHNLLKTHEEIWYTKIGKRPVDRKGKMQRAKTSDYPYSNAKAHYACNDREAAFEKKELSEADHDLQEARVALQQAIVHAEALNACNENNGGFENEALSEDGIESEAEDNKNRCSEAVVLLLGKCASLRLKGAEEMRLICKQVYEHLDSCKDSSTADNLEIARREALQQACYVAKLKVAIADMQLIQYAADNALFEEAMRSRESARCEQKQMENDLDGSVAEHVYWEENPGEEE